MFESIDFLFGWWLPVLSVFTCFLSFDLSDSRLMGGTGCHISLRVELYIFLNIYEKILFSFNFDSLIRYSL